MIHKNGTSAHSAWIECCIEYYINRNGEILSTKGKNLKS